MSEFVGKMFYMNSGFAKAGYGGIYDLKSLVKDLESSDAVMFDAPTSPYFIGGLGGLGKSSEFSTAISLDTPYLCVAETEDVSSFNPLTLKQIRPKACFGFLSGRGKIFYASEGDFGPEIESNWRFNVLCAARERIKKLEEINLRDLADSYATYHKMYHKTTYPSYDHNKSYKIENTDYFLKQSFKINNDSNFQEVEPPSYNACYEILKSKIDKE
jgi:hypothetical protein